MFTVIFSGKFEICFQIFFSDPLYSLFCHSILHAHAHTYAKIFGVKDFLTTPYFLQIDMMTTPCWEICHTHKFWHSMFGQCFKHQPVIKPNQFISIDYHYPFVDFQFMGVNLSGHLLMVLMVILIDNFYRNCSLLKIIMYVYVCLLESIICCKGGWLCEMSLLSRCLLVIVSGCCSWNSMTSYPFQQWKS